MKTILSAALLVIIPQVSLAYCQSHSTSIDKGDTICFKSTHKQYKCTTNRGQPYLKFLQNVSLKSSLNDSSICNHLDGRNSRPNGKPYGTDYGW